MSAMEYSWAINSRLANCLLRTEYSRDVSRTYRSTASPLFTIILLACFDFCKCYRMNTQAYEYKHAGLLIIHVLYYLLARYKGVKEPQTKFLGDIHVFPAIRRGKTNHPISYEPY